jgi:DNA-binding response OmpR family regulator
MLFVSGDAEAAEVGNAEVLKKPFRQAELAQKLRGLLCRGASDTAAPGQEAPKGRKRAPN